MDPDVIYPNPRRRRRSRRSRRASPARKRRSRRSRRKNPSLFAAAPRRRRSRRRHRKSGRRRSNPFRVPGVSGILGNLMSSAKAGAGLVAGMALADFATEAIKKVLPATMNTNARHRTGNVGAIVVGGLLGRMLPFGLGRTMSAQAASALIRGWLPVEVWSGGSWARKVGLGDVNFATGQLMGYEQPAGLMDYMTDGGMGDFVTESGGIDYTQQ